MISAKAIGMPSAMAPSREPMKIAMVMAGASYRLFVAARRRRVAGCRAPSQLLELVLLLAFLDHDQLLVGHLPVSTRKRS